MTPEIRNAIKAHAVETYPRECCGLLVTDADGATSYMPCNNLSDNKEVFILSPDDYAAAEQKGEIVGLVHSHPDAPATPSQADRVACEASGLPWHIYALPSETWDYLEPCGYEAPLIGRVFVHGVVDCYSLIRDWYKTERGILLMDIERPNDWWYKGGNLYVENFTKAGFVQVDDEPQVGDVILMQILANVPNHGAVYLGGDIILHHLYNCLSRRDVYGGQWRKHTTHILRYIGNA